MTVRVKTVIKYAGGKQLVKFPDGKYVVDVIKNMYDNHRDKVFVDLFCGGLSISLNVKPERCIANDLNYHVIGLYHTIQQQGNDIQKIALENTSENFYQVRKEFNEILKQNPFDERLPHMFYYLNRTCFNGLVRFNKKGEFNSPYGKYKYPNYCHDWNWFQEATKNWCFMSRDWENMLSMVVPEKSFLICDPPYVGTFDAYNPDGFSLADHQRLFDALSAHHGPMVVFNSALPEIVKMYEDAGFDIQYIYREDKINKARGTGAKVPEMFATRGI
jgi:DNA adenine methylase